MSAENRPVSLCIGTITAIDLPNRALLIQQQGGSVQEMNVAPGCRVILNGEKVRLRLLLARDEIEVRYFQENSVLSAVQIDVLRSRRGH